MILATDNSNEGSSGAAARLFRSRGTPVRVADTSTATARGDSAPPSPAQGSMPAAHATERVEPCSSGPLRVYGSVTS